MARELRVLLATAGRPTLLKRTLDSLAACEKPEIFRETIVVENGAPQGAEAIAAASGVQYRHVERPNKSNALNVVLAELDDRCLIFFADDDVRFGSDVLTRYAEAAAGVEGGVFFGGPAGVDCETPPPAWLCPYLPPSVLGWKLDGASLDDDRVVFLGFNWAAFVGDLRRAGMFDPRYGPGGDSGAVGQEAEMQHRLRQQGVQPRYVAEPMVWHFVPADRCSPGWAARRIYRYGIKDALLRERHAWSLPGFVRWRLLCVVRPAASYLLTRLATDPETRFKAQWRLCEACGRVKGSWLASHRLRAAQEEQRSQ